MASLLLSCLLYLTRDIALTENTLNGRHTVIYQILYIGLTSSVVQVTTTRRTMRDGFVYSLQRREVYYKLKRQIVSEYRFELAQNTGLTKSWLRWKRRIALEIRYKQLLFSTNLQIIY